MRVASLWVSRPGDGAIPLPCALRHDPEIVPVEMHGMRQRNQSADDEANRSFIVKIVHVPLRVVRIRRVSQLCQEQDRVAV